MFMTRPNKWGLRIDLEDASLACTHADPNSVHYILSTHAVLVFFATEPQWQISLNSDKKRTGIIPSGSIEIVPAQSEVIASWASYKHSLRVDITPGRLQRLAAMEFGKDTFELHPTLIGAVDSKAYKLQPQTAAFRLLVRHFQPLPSPNALNPLDVHDPASLVQHRRDATIAIATILEGERCDVRS